jgi:hypothetical protein
MQFLIVSGKKLMTTDSLCLVFVPALAAVLQAAEDKRARRLLRLRFVKSETDPPASLYHSARRWLWKKIVVIQTSLLRTVGVNGSVYGL